MIIFSFFGLVFGGLVWFGLAKNALGHNF